jgi:small ligand-binding sensory domain FIST
VVIRGFGDTNAVRWIVVIAGIQVSAVVGCVANTIVVCVIVHKRSRAILGVWNAAFLPAASFAGSRVRKQARTIIQLFARIVVAGQRLVATRTGIVLAGFLSEVVASVCISASRRGIRSLQVRGGDKTQNQSENELNELHDIFVC